MSNKTCSVNDSKSTVVCLLSSGRDTGVTVYFLHVILILKFLSLCLIVETHPESEPLILTCLIGDTPTLCSTPGRPSACTSPSRPSSPAPARTGKSFLCQTACQVMCLEF